MFPRAETLAYFRRAEGAHADHAIEVALQNTQDAERGAVLVDLFLHRDRPEALAALLAKYPELPPEVQARVREACRQSPVNLGQSLQLGAVVAAINGLGIIEELGDIRLAYLAGAALRDRSASVRERAAQALKSLSERCLRETQGAPMAGANGPTGPEPRQELVQALRPLVEQYVGHRHSEVLDAAMLLVDDMRDLLFRHEGGRRPLTHALLERLERAGDARHAAFAIEALVHPEFRAGIISVLSRLRDSRFFAAVLTEAPRWRRPETLKVLRGIRQLAWLESGISPLIQLPDGLHAVGVEFIAACGLPEDVFRELLRGILDFDSPAALVQTVRVLIEHGTPGMNELLEVASGVACPEAQRLARGELARRKSAAGAGAAHPEDETDAAWRRFLHEQGLELGFESLWGAADRLQPGQCVAGAAMAFAHLPDFVSLVRERLHHPGAAVRARAHRLIAAFRIYAAFATEIFSHADDPDWTVRTLAAEALGFVSDPTARRILERISVDSSPSVRAAAIASLTVVGGERCPQILLERCGDDVAVVRMAAVRGLLVLRRPEGARALIEALDDARNAHQLAALALVGRMHLTTLQPHVKRLAGPPHDEQVRRRASRILLDWAATATPQDSRKSEASDIGSSSATPVAGDPLHAAGSLSAHVTELLSAPDVAAPIEPRIDPATARAPAAEEARR